MKKILIILSINLLPILNCNAQIRDYLTEEQDSIEMTSIDSGLANCLNNFVTNLDWGNCISTFRKMWEDTLDITYHKLLSKMDSTLRKSLIASQFAWKLDFDNEEKMWMDIYEKYEDSYGRESYF